jgi:hypothetical protein
MVSLDPRKVYQKTGADGMQNTVCAAEGTDGDHHDEAHDRQVKDDGFRMPKPGEGTVNAVTVLVYDDDWSGLGSGMIERR